MEHMRSWWIQIEYQNSPFSEFEWQSQKNRMILWQKHEWIFVAFRVAKKGSQSIRFEPQMEIEKNRDSRLRMGNAENVLHRPRPGERFVAVEWRKINSANVIPSLDILWHSSDRSSPAFPVLPATRTIFYPHTFSHYRVYVDTLWWASSTTATPRNRGSLTTSQRLDGYEWVCSLPLVRELLRQGEGGQEGALLLRHLMTWRYDWSESICSASFYVLFPSCPGGGKAVNTPF